MVAFISRIFTGDGDLVKGLNFEPCHEQQNEMARQCINLKIATLPLKFVASADSDYGPHCPFLCGTNQFRTGNISIQIASVLIYECRGKSMKLK